MVHIRQEPVRLSRYGRDWWRANGRCTRINGWRERARQYGRESCLKGLKFHCTHTYIYIIWFWPLLSHRNEILHCTNSEEPCSDFCSTKKTISAFQSSYVCKQCVMNSLLFKALATFSLHWDISFSSSMELIWLFTNLLRRGLRSAN